MSRLGAVLTEHNDCRWEEVGPCVYCADHSIRLYQGGLPESRDPGRAERQAACAHDWDDEWGQGFYGLCVKCGYKEWFE